MSRRLADQSILNTRPQHQQAELTRLCESEGARVSVFPSIAIETAAPGETNQCLRENLASYDILLFVSRNSVDGAFDLIGDVDLSQPRLGVIGSATRTALAARVDDLEQRLISGEPYNSEGLLEAEALQDVAGRRILILRGQPGRNLLGDELARRGAQVDYAEVYRRVLPDSTPRDFNRLVEADWPTLVILTSNEGMHNLLALVDTDAAARLCVTPWLLISERMRESALKLGHNAPILIAQSASDLGIFETICAWASAKHTNK